MTDIFIYPTDTAYALGCDARSAEAVARIFVIKGRVETKALPLIAADIAMVREWCELSGQAEELAEKYWPGPLTLVLPVKKSGLAAAVIAEGAVAIRVPDQKEARALARRLGGPIVSTSANKAGGNNCYSLSEVRTSLGEASNRVGRIIDIGELPQRPVSTIVKVCDNKIIVIREGAVKI